MRFLVLFLVVVTTTNVVSAFSLSKSSSSSQFQEQKVQLSNGITGTITKGIPSPPSSPNPFADVFNQNKKKEKPVLLFLHGSFHGSWCWEEYFMPFFVEKGYPVVAFNWRGTSGTPTGNPDIKKVKVSEHINDLQCLLDTLPEIVGSNVSGSNANIKPILLSHSFGGIIVMKYLEELYTKNKTGNLDYNDLFSGFITMCSVPPSGNGKLTLRYLQRSLIDSYKITAGFAMKKCITDKKLCRDLFFGGSSSEDNDSSGISDDDIERYQTNFKLDSDDATIDLIDLGKQLPSFQCTKDGIAPFINAQDGDGTTFPPTLVVGAKDDFIVDEQAVVETATYFDSGKPAVVDSPHDVMLGSTWKNTATIILEFIENKIL